MDTNTIKKRIAAIEKLKEELKVSKEAIANALANDALYQNTLAEAKTINLKKKQEREAILAESANQEFVEKMKETKEELGTLEELLAYELVEYSQKNNTDMIEGDDGLVRKFKITVRLLPTRGFDDQSV